MFFFYLPLIFISALNASDYVQELQSKARELNLHADIQWLNLGHYKKSRWYGKYLGSYESEADGPAFFLASDGKKNPEAELMATLAGFFSEPSLDQKPGTHPQCAFPARLIWLSKKLEIDQRRLPKLNCAEFEKFRDVAAARSATVVFSSYFLNNTASAFGHSLLRLNRSSGAKGEDRFALLDTGINYAAVVTTENPIFYAFNGLFGFFKGTFASMPYYYKVREYNDFEARDLWEYDLNLSQEQIDLIVAHLWELGHTYFNYYYLFENCSYHILTVLDVADSHFKLAERMPVYVIPADTIRALMDTPGLVREVHYRPSLRVQFSYRLSKLNSKQRELLSKVLDAEKPELDSSDLSSDQERAEVLDASLDYIDMQYAKQILGDEESPAKKLKNRFLRARSQVHYQTPELKMEAPEKEAPHGGHRSARAGIGHGWFRSKPYINVSMRFALHDLLDPTNSYPQYGQLEFFNLSVNVKYRSFLRSRLELDDFAIVRNTSFTPLSTYTKYKSWRVRIGATQLRDQTCFGCIVGVVDGGMGVTAQPFSLFKTILYGLAEGEILGSPKLKGKTPVTVGVGPTLGLRTEFTSSWLALAEGGYRYRAFMDEPHVFFLSGRMRLSLWNKWALDGMISRYMDSTEYRIGLFHYF